MIDEEEHKMRFKQVADLFSKQKSDEFEPVIHSHVSLEEFLYDNWIELLSADILRQIASASYSSVLQENASLSTLLEDFELSPLILLKTLFMVMSPRTYKD